MEQPFPPRPRLCTFLLCTALLLGCRSGAGEPEDHQPTAQELVEARAEVEDVVDRFGRMWEDEDMATFDQIIAQDADLVVVGTDAAEQIVGFDRYRETRVKQFSSFENVEFDVRNRVIKVGSQANTAWFSEEFDLLMLANGSPVSLEGLRLTGGLEKRDDGWVIVQLHTSVAVPGQAAEY